MLSEHACEHCSAPLVNVKELLLGMCSYCFSRVGTIPHPTTPPLPPIEEPRLRLHLPLRLGGLILGGRERHTQGRGSDAPAGP